MLLPVFGFDRLRDRLLLGCLRFLFGLPSIVGAVMDLWKKSVDTSSVVDTNKSGQKRRKNEI